MMNNQESVNIKKNEDLIKLVAKRDALGRALYFLRNSLLLTVACFETVQTCKTKPAHCTFCVTKLPHTHFVFTF